MSKFFAALGGFLLLAPAAHATLNVSSAATKNVTCASNTCSATAKNAVLNVGELSAMLASNDVTVVANGDAQTIGISTSFSWASTHMLTLSAHHDVVIKVPVAVEGLGGVHVLTRVGTGDEDGDLKFLSGGRIDFWDTGASFDLNGTDYALVNDVASVGSAYTSDANANVALAKDYDAGPDGTYNNAAVIVPAHGSFEGLGHTVSNFSVAGTGRWVGFFSQTSGAIRDVTFSNAQVTNNDITDDAHPAFAGALAGSSSGTITGAHASGTVTALDWSYAGGLSGMGPAVLRSDSSAAIGCGKHCHAGGLVGYGGSYLLSHATGSVTVGEHSVAGGLVGVIGNVGAGTIAQSFATGDLVSIKKKNDDLLGGLVGEALQDSTITDSYALGAVRNKGDSQLGGLLGYGFANAVRTSYSAGAVGTRGTLPRSWIGTGGFIGFAHDVDRADYTNDYWDVDTSHQTVGCGDSKRGCPKPTGLSNAELKAQLPAGFDPAIWGQSASINNGFPYLLANPPE